MPRYDDRHGSTRLYVGHLASRTRSRDLEDIFSRYGRLAFNYQLLLTLYFCDLSVWYSYAYPSMFIMLHKPQWCLCTIVPSFIHFWVVLVVLHSPFPSWTFYLKVCTKLNHCHYWLSFWYIQQPLVLKKKKKSAIHQVKKLTWMIFMKVYGERLPLVGRFCRETFGESF